MYRRKLIVILGCGLLLLCGLVWSGAATPHAFAASTQVNISKATANPDTSCPPEIGYGNTGKWVTYLQQSLNSQYTAGTFTNYPYNFYPHSRGHGLTVDGIFGSDTENATKDFQYAHNLSVDGIVGPHTWHALGWC